MKLRFTKLPSEYSTTDTTTVSFELEEDSLEDIVSEFKLFLLACGFHTDTIEDYFHKDSDE